MEQVQKVLMVCKSLPDTFLGGIQTAVWSLSKALVERGIAVSILTAGSSKERAHRLVREGIILERIPYFPGRKLPFGNLMAEETAFNLAAARWIRQHGKAYDLIHLQGRSGALALRHKTGLPPMIATFHGSIQAELANQVFHNFIDRRWYPRQANRWEKEVWENADGHIVITQAMVEVLQTTWGMGKCPMEVITNGIVARPAPLSGPQPGQPLLMVGRLEPIKGLMTLMEVFPELPSDTTLRVVGEGSDRAKAEAFARTHGLTDRVTFLGRQPAEVVKQEIEAAYLMVVPSVFEAQGIVVLEAFQGGRPVVATAVGGIPEMVVNGEQGLLTPVGDRDALRDALRWMLDHPDAVAEMGGKALAKSHFYTWDLVAELTASFYHHIRFS